MITLSQYLAYNEEPVREAVIQVMRDKRYVIEPRNEEELVNCIDQFIKHESERGNYDQAMMSLASVHPDKEMIMAGMPGKLGADGIGSDLDTEIPKQKKQKSAVTIAYPENNTHSSLASHCVIAGIFSLALLGMVAIIVKK